MTLRLSSVYSNLLSYLPFFIKSETYLGKMAYETDSRHFTLLLYILLVPVLLSTPYLHLISYTKPTQQACCASKNPNVCASSMQRGVDVSTKLMLPVDVKARQM